MHVFLRFFFHSQIVYAIKCMTVFVYQHTGGRSGRDQKVVGFTNTHAISGYHHWCCEFESRSGRGVQHYVIKFFSDLRQVDYFPRVLRFPPPIKLTSTI